jgi:hypothetical protein
MAAQSRGHATFTGETPLTAAVKDRPMLTGPVNSRYSFTGSCGDLADALTSVAHAYTLPLSVPAQ